MKMGGIAIEAASPGSEIWRNGIKLSVEIGTPGFFPGLFPVRTAVLYWYKFEDSITL